MNGETSKELKEKENYYSAIAALEYKLAKMDDTNEEWFENITFLLYLILEKI